MDPRAGGLRPGRWLLVPVTGPNRPRKVSRGSKSAFVSMEMYDCRRDTAARAPAHLADGERVQQ